MNIKTRKGFVIGLIVILLFTALVHAAAYYGIKYIKNGIDKETYSVSDKELLSPKQAIFNELDFFLSLLLSMFVVGGMGYVMGERELTHHKLTKEKKIDNLNETSVLELAQYAQREIHQGLHHEFVKLRLHTEGWHPNTVKRVFKHVHIPKEKRAKK